MANKIISLCCVFVIFLNTCTGHVRRDLSFQSTENPLAKFQMNIEQLKHCIDQSLSKSVAEVNEKQLQPVFTALGDSLNRFSKAFEDLTGTPKKTDDDWST